VSAGAGAGASPRTAYRTRGPPSNSPSRPSGHRTRSRALEPSSRPVRDLGFCLRRAARVGCALGRLKGGGGPVEFSRAMKWLNRTSPPPTKPHVLTPRSITIEPDTRNNAPAQAVVEESEQTQKSAIPDEIRGEPTPAPTLGPSRRDPGRHHSPTLASPIPAILAESMALAEEGPAPAARPAAERTPAKIARERR
jgi:hypothetical protein